MVFAKNLKAARIAADLSQRSLSDVTTVPQRIIVAAEAGRQNLTLETMRKLAVAVGKTVPELLTPVGPRGKPPRTSPKT